ncbi:DUF4328 domain-containing protein [Haloechinothrix halophila]|uniref:DUF4328 domain-containing protein n=1 Tax=Haloechinothrix halophila TaxID=1069073 RepID=UPI000403A471|nr:DUF4328 domain-containing protein [Haloechinothrix halophila]
MSEPTTPQSGPHPPVPPNPSEPPLPAAPPPSGSLRPTRILGWAAAVLIVLYVLADLALAVLAWSTEDVIAEYLAGDAASVAPFNVAMTLTSVAGTLSFATFIASAVVFVIWLWRARVNAELLCRAQHTRSRGWVWGGWICPVVLLWFPFQIVRDVWKASHPDVAPDGYNMHLMPFTKVLGLWWAVWLFDLAVDQYIVRRDIGEQFDPLIGANVLSFVLSAIAGGLLIRLIMQISSWQETKMSQPQLVAAY